MRLLFRTLLWERLFVYGSFIRINTILVPMGPFLLDGFNSDFVIIIIQIPPLTLVTNTLLFTLELSSLISCLNTFKAVTFVLMYRS